MEQKNELPPCSRIISRDVLTRRPKEQPKIGHAQNAASPGKDKL